MERERALNEPPQPRSTDGDVDVVAPPRSTRVRPRAKLQPRKLIVEEAASRTPAPGGAQTGSEGTMPQPLSASSALARSALGRAPTLTRSPSHNSHPIPPPCPHPFPSLPKTPYQVTATVLVGAPAGGILAYTTSISAHNRTKRITSIASIHGQASSYHVSCDHHASPKGLAISNCTSRSQVQACCCCCFSNPFHRVHALCQTG